MSDYIDALKNKIILDNSLYDYGVCLFVIFAGFISLQIIKKVFLKRTKQYANSSQNQADDIVVEYTKKAIIPLINFGVIFLALLDLKLPNLISKILNILAILVMTFFCIRFITGILTRILDKYLFSKQEAYTALLLLIKIILWSVGIIFLLDNIGFKISTIVAGLGIGGIAVALAAQTALADLFSYIAILLDRPFEPGDFIVVDDKAGTVQKIGLKTTRIISVSGEQLIFSNSDLTKSRVQNQKGLKKRRVAFNLEVSYQTTIDNLKLIPEIIKKIIENTPKTQFERCHMLQYKDIGLSYEVVYHILSIDYEDYAKVHHEINLKIFEEFVSKKIEFAYAKAYYEINLKAFEEFINKKIEFAYENKEKSI